jgi:hypothetical protein
MNYYSKVEVRHRRNNLHHTMAAKREPVDQIFAVKVRVLPKGRLALKKDIYKLFML